MASGARNLIAGNRAEEFAALLGDARQVITLLPDARQVGLVPDALLTTHLAPTYGRGADATPMALRKPA
jgi:hypothetical protein